MVQPRRQQWVKSVDGVGLAVREWGAPSGRPIVFIHGWSHGQLAFLRQYQGCLANDFRLISYDLRGHGESDHPAGLGAYDSGTPWTDDLDAVMRATDVERPVLIGWSFGGRIIGEYLHRFGSGNVAGINLVSVAAFAPPGLAMRGPDAVASRMIDQNFETLAETAAFFARKCANTPLTDTEFALMFGAAMATSADARKGSMLWQTDYSALCRTLARPVLITHGRDDTFTLPIAAEASAPRFAEAALSIFEGSGHMPFWDNAKRFNAELAAFVARCGA